MLGRQIAPLDFDCPSTMKAGRAVTINFATGYADFTAAGDAPDGISLTDAQVKRIGGLRYSCPVRFIKAIDGLETVTIAAAVSKGDSLEVIGDVGKFQTLALGDDSNLVAMEDGSGDDAVISVTQNP